MLKSQNAQYGFTLIELMISIVLGLLITAAAVQILITSQSSITTQQASSDIQTDGSFGIAGLTKRIRMANFGARETKDQSAFVMNSDTPYGGIVLTNTASKAFPPLKEANLLMDLNNVQANDFLSKSKKIDSTNKSSNLKTIDYSDQLTIQRRVDNNIFTCEGTEVEATTTAPKQLVERYFVRKTGTRDTDLGLACKAAVYLHSASGAVQSKFAKFKVADSAESSLSGDGQVLVNGVDHFHYLLGIDTNSDTAINPDKATMGYVTVSDYMDDTKFPKPKPRIVSIKLALLVRSNSNVVNAKKDTDQKYSLLELENMELKNTGGKFQRQVFENTIFIRNARG